MGKLINEDIINRVNEATDIVDLISGYLELKPSGSNFLGLCPFHNEKTPSFSVSRSKQFYHCFGCGAGGDAIEFVMNMDNLSFIDAVNSLADKSGIILEDMTEEDKKKLDKREKIYNINRDAARFYYDNLKKDKRAYNYLLNRGLSPKTIGAFGLGFVEEGWDLLLNYLRHTKGYSEDEIFEAGLSSMRRNKTGYYDKFRNRIIFPIINPSKKVIGFGGRVMGDDMPKYLNSQDTLAFTKGDNLYGLNMIDKNLDNILLVEGYMDVISLYNEGIRYSVASLGTALTENQGKLLKRYGRNIFICYDSDPAGRNATLKAMKILRNLGIDPKAIVLPEGYDPDEYIKEEGVDSFNYLIKREAMNYLDFNIYLNKIKYNLSNPEEKIEFTRSIASMIRELKSPIEREVYIDKISLDTGISRESILEESKKKQINIVEKNYNKFNDRKNIQTSFPKEKVKLEPAYVQAEKVLLKMALDKKEYYSLIVSSMVSSNGFVSEGSLRVFDYLISKYEEGLEVIKIEDLKSSLEDDRDFLCEIENVDLKILNKNKDEIIKLIGILDRTKLEQERNNILIDIKKAEDEIDTQLLNELTIKLMDINKKLKN